MWCQSRFKYRCVPNRSPHESSIIAEGGGEWNACQHDGPKRGIWRNIHIGVDESTQEIRAIEVISSRIGDAPMLPDSLSQVPPDQELALQLLEPYTPGGTRTQRNRAILKIPRLGSVGNLTGYHRRSRVKTKPLGTFLAEIPCRSVDALCVPAWTAPLGT